ncbi:MAG: 16S rRNA (guanine(527)-N(7))-methyltransferase RsmG [Propionibacteriaceae bacterium]|nr:16S rRNA (guanine(527)-N(7))-methyltransferase RsmG [Propionibacteriaceae bacterium]
MDVPIPEHLRPLCDEVFGDRLPLAMAYAGLLAREGIEWGLIGPRERDRMWDRHILNSMCVSGLIPRGCQVADVGSGAGLPGIPLAIARPDLRIELVEPMRRRVDFLTMCVERLGLEATVSVVRASAQEYVGTASIVTCRALAPVRELIVMMDHVVKHAPVLAIKGQRAELEIAAAGDQLIESQLFATVLRPEVGGEVLGTVVRLSRNA